MSFRTEYEDGLSVSNYLAPRLIILSDTTLSTELTLFCWDQDFDSFQLQLHPKRADSWVDIPSITDLSVHMLSPEEIRDLMVEAWRSHVRAQFILGSGA